MDRDCCIQTMSLLLFVPYDEIRQLVGADPRMMMFRTENQEAAAMQMCGDKTFDEIHNDPDLMQRLMRMKPEFMGVDIHQINHVFAYYYRHTQVYQTVEGSYDKAEAEARNYPTSLIIKELLISKGLPAFVGCKYKENVHAVAWDGEKIEDPAGEIKELDQIVVSNVVFLVDDG